MRRIRITIFAAIFLFLSFFSIYLNVLYYTHIFFLLLLLLFLRSFVTFIFILLYYTAAAAADTIKVNE